MNRPIHQFLAKDHDRIDQLLNKAIGQLGEIDSDSYHQFRTQLLRHIKMEEKVLFPAAKKADPALMQELIARYRLEHGALTALMVPPPTLSLIKVIRHLLERHNGAEEEPNGLYDICEALTQEQTQEILDQLAATEEVPVHPPNPALFALESAKRSLARAGYDFDEMVRSAY